MADKPFNVRNTPPAHRAPGGGGKGPWGRLQRSTFFLECPAVHLDKFFCSTLTPGWSVAVSDTEKVLTRLAWLGLPGDFIEWIRKPENQIRKGDQIIFLLPEEGLLHLPPGIRAAVYRELYQYPENLDIIGPHLIPKEKFDTWFVNSSLEPEVINLIKQMCYPRGDALAFSDFALLSRFLNSAAKVRKVFSILYRTPALMLNLILDKKSNVNDIAHYWSTGYGRATAPNHIPFLKSLQAASDIGMLDVEHLLPPLPRKLLNTYLPPSSFGEGENPDCHWSSLNFFKPTEEPFFLQSHFVANAFMEKYQTVRPPYRFGDIIAFVSADGNAFHSCVYIADDVVFTKNGRNILSPWVFQSLAYVKMTFLYHNNGRIVGYRPKGDR